MDEQTRENLAKKVPTPVKTTAPEGAGALENEKMSSNASKKTQNVRSFAPDENALAKLLEDRSAREMKRTAQTIDLVCFHYQGFSPVEVARMDAADFNARLRTIYREQNREFREKVIAAVCGFDGKMAKKTLKNIAESDKRLG